MFTTKIKLRFVVFNKNISVYVRVSTFMEFFHLMLYFLILKISIYYRLEEINNKHNDKNIISPSIFLTCVNLCLFFLFIKKNVLL